MRGSSPLAMAVRGKQVNKCLGHSLEQVDMCGLDPCYLAFGLCSCQEWISTIHDRITIVEIDLLVTFQPTDTWKRVLNK